MATPSKNLLTLVLLFFFFIHPIAIEAVKKPFRPKALVLPIAKDPKTNQYLTVINQRTPLVPIKLTLDLGGQYQWVDCEKGYVSSTYKPVLCGSVQCKLASRLESCSTCFSGPKPGCNNNTCSVFLTNSVDPMSTSGEVAADAISVRSTDGSKQGQAVLAPSFAFSCASTFLLKGLARGVKGVAGLGRGKISLPSQFASVFRFPKKFALCLSSSNNGIAFFGDGPYVLRTDVSKSLVFTPLIWNPVSTVTAFEGDPSYEYFIRVKSVKINGKNVPFDKELLKINKEGFGGTKVSTTDPYTVLHTSIYNAVLKTFTKELARVPRVGAVEPFGVCYNSTFISYTRVGPGVPTVDLVLEKKVLWRIWGSNSMVNVKKDVICLGFVDGGVDARTSIVIGGHQLEDNLLQFDLAASKLGFSSSLLMRQTHCGNFNFTSNA